MYKRLILVLLVGIVVVMPLSSATASEIIKSQSEMIQWDPDRAYNGYNAFTKANKAYLVDMEGYIVNSWEPATDAGLSRYIHALENGRWRVSNHPSYAPTGVLRFGGVEGRIEEYTWEGDRFWWMDVFDGDDDDGDPTTPNINGTFRQHHDWQRMYNSEIGEWTYLCLLWVAKGEVDADNLGVSDALDGRSRGTGSTWSPDALIEILPDYANGEGGDVIWYWTFTDHMVTTDPDNRAATGSWTDWSGRISMPPVDVGAGNTAGIRANPQLLDVHGMHYTVPDGPRPDYQHCNSFDYDEATGYIAINAKAANEFFVIDHDGTFDLDAATNNPGTAANGYDTNAVGAEARTTDGDFKYRFGNPGNYYSGAPAGFYNEGDMEMYGTHDIQWIWDYHWRPPMPGDNWAAPTAEFALQGAGNFLMFDNGCYNPRMAGSKILEVNPYISDRDAYDNSGFVETDYVDPGPLAINAPTPALSRRDQVVWAYGGGGTGPSDFYSSYISGTTRMPNGNTIICSGANSHFFEVEAGAEGNMNANDVVWEYIVPLEDDGEFLTTFENRSGTFRFHRFSSSHPALVGKNLRRGNTLTGTVPGTTNVSVPALTGWGTGNKVGAGGGGGGAAAGAGGGGY